MAEFPKISETNINSHWEREINDPFAPVPKCGGGSSSSSNSTNNKNKTYKYHLFNKLFSNIRMSDSDCFKVENMLNKIIDDCMGGNLYNGLIQKLNGKTFVLKLNNDETGSFDGKSVSIDLNNGSNQLLHEIFHAYQGYQEKDAHSYNMARLNLEIEAYYAQYIYVEKMSEFKNSKYEMRYNKNLIYSRIKELNDILDSKGHLKEGKVENELCDKIDKYVIPAMRLGAYKNYPFDTGRKGLNIFKNINELTKNC